MDRTTTALADHGAAFLALHHATRGFVMPNAWDAGSAVVLAAEGFAALGSTSAGIAFSLGRPDYGVADAALAVDRDTMLAAVQRIAAAVPLPVNADLEAGYGETPEAVAATVREAIAVGAAGCNLEDVDPQTGRLFDIGTACARLAAARRAIDSSGRGFVLTARTDSVLARAGGSAVESALDAAIERGRAYLSVGADAVFVPGIVDADLARRLVRGIEGPVTLVAGLGEARADLNALLDAGVQRISVGGSIARAALALVQRAARDLRRGRVDYAAEQLPQAALNALFAQARSRSVD